MTLEHITPVGKSNSQNLLPMEVRETINKGAKLTFKTVNGIFRDTHRDSEQQLNPEEL